MLHRYPEKNTHKETLRPLLLSDKMYKDLRKYMNAWVSRVFVFKPNPS